MPTYVYKREDGTTFEIVQRMTEPALETDPESGQKVRRIPTAGAGFVFKGTGFYLTDYKDRSGTDKAEAKPDAKPAGGETKGDAGASTAAKPEPSAKPAEATPATVKPAAPKPKADG